MLGRPCALRGSSTAPAYEEPRGALGREAAAPVEADLEVEVEAELEVVGAVTLGAYDTPGGGVESRAPCVAEFGRERRELSSFLDAPE